MTREIIVVIQTLQFSQLFRNLSRHLFPVTFSFFEEMLFNFLILLSIKCDNGPFLHFSSTTFIYPTCGNILQDFGSINCIFIRTFSSVSAVHSFKFPRHFDFQMFVSPYSLHVTFSSFKVVNKSSVYSYL